MKRAVFTSVLVVILSVFLNAGCELKNDPNSSLNQSTGPPDNGVAQRPGQAESTVPPAKGTISLADSDSVSKSSDSPPIGTDPVAGKTTDNPSLLVQKELQSFYDRIVSEDEAERLAALDAMLPEEKHFVKLFGAADGKRLFELITPNLEKMRQNSDEVKKELGRNGEIAGIYVTDLRESEAERFAMIPAEIPVFSVAIRFKNGNGTGSSTYLVFDGDVIMIRGLERMPRYLKSNPK